MERANRPHSIKQITGMLKRETMRTDHYLQRPSGQWGAVEKDNLIASVFDMFVPTLVVLRKPDEDFVPDPDKPDQKPPIINWLIDGVQRTTNFDSFVAGRWKLGQMEKLKIETTGEYEDFSGKYFHELSAEAQEQLLVYNLNFMFLTLEDDDDEEALVERVFTRLNSGKAVSLSHMAFVAAPTEIQKYIVGLLETKLFQEKAHFAEGDRKTSQPHVAVMQSMILAEGLSFPDLGNKTIKKIMATHEFSQETLDKVTKAYGILQDVYEEPLKFLTKVNIVCFSHLLIQHDFDMNVVEFLKSYINTINSNDLYRRNSKGATTKATAVKARLMGLNTLYDKFVEQQAKEAKENQKETA